VHDDAKEGLSTTEQGPHRILWGFFDGATIDVEPRVRQFNPEDKSESVWTLDTAAYPRSEAMDYRLRVAVPSLTPASERPARRRMGRLDLVGIGLSAVSSIARLKQDPASTPDCKADLEALWEPEFGTFAPFLCHVLGAWKRSTGLITSMGDDSVGRQLRRLLAARSIELLFCAATANTGRQFAFTPPRSDRRYNLDLQIQREPLTEQETKVLAAALPRICQARVIAYDKYELRFVRRLFNSESWKATTAVNQRPFVLYETGSRPAPEDDLDDIFVENIDLFTTTEEWKQARVARRGLRSLEKLRNLCVLTTCGSRGAQLEIPDESEPLLLPLPEGLVEDAADRRGAGDILRAGIIEQLLERGNRAEMIKVLRTHGPEIVDSGQRTAKRWLTRFTAPGKDYLGPFTHFRPSLDR
jgi:sugar/nucleoside kinase (ribokinase family)